MLTIEFCDKKIQEYQDLIKYLSPYTDKWREGYVEHLENLIEAYKVEKSKALLREPPREVSYTPSIPRWGYREGFKL